jgi:hypothetical protein
MKHKFSISVLIIFLAGIGFASSIIQKKQEIRTHASAATRLYLSPESTLSAPIKKNTGDKISLDVMVDPGGINKLSLLKLQIAFNPSAFETTGTTTFVANKDAFPAIMEGPVVDNDNGYIYITFSVGADRGKTIQKATRVGTINLVAKQSVKLVDSAISFDSKSKALSTSSTDHAYENVIGSATPAYIAIAGEELTEPTITQANVAPTSSDSDPAADPSPTLNAPTPTPLPNETVLSFETILDGIGNGGDNTNPLSNTFSNKNPQNRKRNITLSLLSTLGEPFLSKKGFAMYNESKGSFEGTISLGTDFPTGNYIIKIKSDGYLRKQLSGVHYIKSASRTQIPNASLITGDINDDNAINILDYNLLTSCYSDLVINTSCDTTKKMHTDLTDDGKVDNIDYNLFIREISAQNGD